MSKRTTPETETLYSRLLAENPGNLIYLEEMLCHARSLERERDEWAALCGQYKQERDDAREMLQQYMFDRSGTWIDFLPADKPMP